MVYFVKVIPVPPVLLGALHVISTSDPLKAVVGYPGAVGIVIAVIETVFENDPHPNMFLALYLKR